MLSREGVKIKSSTTAGGKAPTKGFAAVVLEFAPAKTASSVASTILDQMGGTRRLSAMTGAHAFADHGSGVSFLFPNRQRSKGNGIKITLRNDLYDVEFRNVSIRGAKKVKAYDGVYADQLVPIFEKQTGLYLRL